MHVPVSVKLSMYIMAPEPISTAHLKIPPINLFVYMCIPPISAREQLCNMSTVAKSTHNNGRIFGHIVFMQSVLYQGK
jgi:hypothetical protein